MLYVSVSIVAIITGITVYECLFLQTLFVHEMPNISFASGGDSETLEFVSYVAKDRNNVRSCFVLECGGGLAQDVITTIGQAFELR